MLQFIANVMDKNKLYFFITISLIIINSILESFFYISLIPILSHFNQPIIHNSLINSFINTLTDHVTIHWIFAFYILFGLIIFISNYYKTKVTNIIQTRFINNISQRVFQSIINLPYNTFIQTPKANYTHYLVDETNKMSLGVNFIILLFSTCGLLLIQFGLAFMLNFKLTLLIIVISGISIFFINKLNRYAKQNGRLLLLNRQKLHFNVEQILNSRPEISIYHHENQTTEKYLIEQNNLNQTLIKSHSFISLVNNLSKFFAIIILCIMFYSAIYIFKLDLTIITVLVLIFMRIFPQLNSISSTILNLNHITPSFNKLHSLIKPINTNINPIQCEFKQSITFNNVDYHIDHKQILSNISFNIKSGTTTLICGETGSGKSSIINLLTGLIPQTDGLITIDGINIDQCVYSWQQQIAYVSTSCALFNLSIKDNLTFFTPANNTEIMDVLKMVRLDKMINQLPEGLNTIIGDNGIKLSNGERQRLVLARAILRNPRVLILDEATSMLDEQTEIIIHNTLNKLYAKMTLIIVSHRIHTMQNINQIITIDKGVIKDVRYPK